MQPMLYIYISRSYSNLGKGLMGLGVHMPVKVTEPNTFYTLEKHTTNSNISLDFSLYNYAKH